MTLYFTPPGTAIDDLCIPIEGACVLFLYGPARRAAAECFNDASLAQAIADGVGRDAIYKHFADSWSKYGSDDFDCVVPDAIDGEDIAFLKAIGAEAVSYSG